MIPCLLFFCFIGFTHYKTKNTKKILLFIGFVLFTFILNYFNSVYPIYYFYILLIIHLFLNQERSNYLTCGCLSICILILAYLSFKYHEELLVGIVVLLMILSIQIHQTSLQHLFENSSTSFQNKLLKNQIDEVHNIYMTMRGWRHDYHNHLQSLKAKLSKNQINEAITYLNELEVDLDDIKQIVESGNIQIDAILNSKLSLALNHDIDLNVKVLIPKQLPFSEIDCCALLGNLIDNAIEACEPVQDHKFIRLYIGLYRKQFYISITNATTELVRKLDEEYITNKRGNHGHGLKRINLIVEKYHGYINRKNEPGIFVTEILLPMNQTCTN